VPRHPPNALKTLDRSHYRYSLLRMLAHPSDRTNPEGFVQGPPPTFSGIWAAP
jgi:hypothetical protein